MAAAGRPPSGKTYGMPELSRFFGITVHMRYRDHDPPHFHVRYGGRKASVAGDPLRLLAGDLPPRILGFVMEWAALHQQELLVDWNLSRQGLPPRKIAPLE